MIVQGIDISKFQGTIQWPSVQTAGIQFAYIKATEGLQQDPGHGARTAYFKDNWPRIKNAGILRGAYHFFRPDFDPTLQADTFLQAIDSLEDTDLPPMLDVESAGNVSSDVLIARTHDYLARIQAQSGITPIVYTSYSFWNDNLDNSFSSQYPLWIASYGSDAPTKPVVPTRSEPTLPPDWSSYVFWQYASHGQVPGIQTTVDLNLFDGAIEDLQSFSAFARQVAQSLSPTVLRLTQPHMQGSGVRALQSALLDAGFLGTVDGDFGPQTDQAVKEFQTQQGLTPDGVVGHQTRVALGLAN